MAKGVRLLEKILDQKPFSIEATESIILDLRGVKGFKIFLNGGTATIREVDESGANVPGSSDAAAVSGQFQATEWPFVKITAATAACTVAVV